MKTIIIAGFLTSILAGPAYTAEYYTKAPLDSRARVHKVNLPQSGPIPTPPPRTQSYPVPQAATPPTDPPQASGPATTNDPNARIFLPMEINPSPTFIERFGPFWRSDIGKLLRWIARNRQDPDHTGSISPAPKPSSSKPARKPKTAKRVEQ